MRFLWNTLKTLLRTRQRGSLRATYSPVLMLPLKLLKFIPEKTTPFRENIFRGVQKMFILPEIMSMVFDVDFVLSEKVFCFMMNIR